MIVCSCNVICDKKVACAVSKLRRSCPHATVTPRKVYNTLGCKAQCKNCMRLVRAVIDGCGNAHAEIEQAEIEQNLCGARSRNAEATKPEYASTPAHEETPTPLMPLDNNGSISNTPLQE